MKIFLAPHNDDETLFGAYTLLRYKPLVIVVLRSFKEATWENGPMYQTREAETAAACEVLGCDWVQWRIPDDDPDWDLVRDNLVELKDEGCSEIFAPWPEPGGHLHHNSIGEIAGSIFSTVSYYATYTHTLGKTVVPGAEVFPEPGWVTLKNTAMSKYKSQIEHPATQAAFNLWPRQEYLVRISQ